MHKGKKRETYASLNEPIMLGEALTPNFGQAFGTFVRSEGPRVALYNRAVVCENYSVITVSLVSQSSAINLSVEMRIPNPKYKGRTRKIPQLRTHSIHMQPYIFLHRFFVPGKLCTKIAGCF